MLEHDIIGHGNVFDTATPEPANMTAVGWRRLQDAATELEKLSLVLMEQTGPIRLDRPTPAQDKSDSPAMTGFASELNAIADRLNTTIERLNYLSRTIEL